jgi:hypothetical protein
MLIIYQLVIIIVQLNKTFMIVDLLFVCMPYCKWQVIQGK